MDTIFTTGNCCFLVYRDVNCQDESSPMSDLFVCIVASNASIFISDLYFAQNKVRSDFRNYFVMYIDVRVSSRNHSPDCYFN